MLRNPLSPSTTLPSFLSSARASASSPRLRIFAAFFLLGLINNVLYVIILSAALDLVGPSVPKGLVLLFDVTPALVLKLCLPFFIHRLRWSTRVWICVCLATSGMALIALSPSAIAHPRDAVATPPPALSSSSTVGALAGLAGDRIKALLGRPSAPSPPELTRPTTFELVLKMTGIALASLASGGGESSFVALTSSYDAGRTSLAAWGSGTGAAGLVGAAAYTLATTSLGLSSRVTLAAFAFLPVGMLVAYFVVLPVANTPVGMGDGGKGIVQREGVTADDEERERLVGNAGEGDEDERDVAARGVEAYAFRARDGGGGFVANLQHARGLVVPYMLPLFLVYFSEYTINQGVSPTLLFPLHETPFTHYRDFYPTYGTMYQLGVFISRSSLPFIRVQALYIPSLLQWLNLALLVAQAVSFTLLPSVYLVLAVIFYEGLLGGLVYVSTFRRIGEEVAAADREFSLAAATVSDSAGICLASFMSMAIETGLCRWQVAHGRDWCKRL